MTTEQQIVSYQIDVKLFTSKKVYKKAKNASAKEVCRVLNGAIYLDSNDEYLLAFNPINTFQPNNNTPVYAVMEDGNKELIDTAYFFSFLSRYNLCRIFVKLDEDELVLHNDSEEVEDRTQWIQLTINAESFVESFVVTTKDEININGTSRECLQFILEDNIKYVEHHERYGLNHPTFKGLPGIVKPVVKTKDTLKTKAAKAALLIDPTKSNKDLDIKAAFGEYNPLDF